MSQQIEKFGQRPHRIPAKKKPAHTSMTDAGFSQNETYMLYALLKLFPVASALDLSRLPRQIKEKAARHYAAWE